MHLTYFRPCVSWLFSLQLPSLLHLQDGLLPPPISAKWARQTFLHCNFSLAIPSPYLTSMHEGHHCTWYQYCSRTQISNAVQYQCSSSLQQLELAHIEHQTDVHRDLKYLGRIKCNPFIIDNTYAYITKPQSSTLYTSHARCKYTQNIN